MKKYISVILVAIMLAAVLPFTAFAAYSVGDIIELGSYPQTRVTDSSLISALNSCTASMFVQILARIDGVNLNSVSYGGKFNDVKVNDWYAKAVQWADNCGVTGGTGNGAFSPNTAVSREQLATFFIAYAKYKGYIFT